MFKRPNGNSNKSFYSRYFLSLGTITSYIWHGGKSRTERSKAVKDHLKTIIQGDRGMPGNAAILKNCLHGLVDQHGKVRKQITEIKAHLERHFPPSGNKKDQHPNQM